VTAVDAGTDRLDAHEAVFVDDDAELLTVAREHLAAGLAAGDLVRASLPGWAVAELEPLLPGAVLLVSDAQPPRREPDLISWIRKTAGEITPRRLRLMGLVTGVDVRDWDERSRCEAVSNLAYGDSAVSLRCVYDRRSTPAAALDTALRTHPQLATPDGLVPSPRFEDPRTFLGGLPVPDEPLERSTPVLALDAAPSLPRLRHQVSEALRGRARDRDVEEDFHLAISEIAANAFRHGTKPISARLWASADRLVCAITDSGTTYRNPLAGYRPAHGDDLSRGGMGLWLARKLCDHVDLIPQQNGFTVRLVTVLH